MNFAKNHLIPAIAMSALLAVAVASSASAAAKPAKPTVHALIEIRDTPAPGDDYVTWAPAPATLQISGAGAKPFDVYLTNEALPADGQGHVNFALSAAAYKQAIDGGATGLDTIKFAVTRATARIAFVVAGAFPHFSRSDKDAVVVAHLGSPSGPVIGRQSLMVRVRRNLETLSTDEKNRFLWALVALRFRKSPAFDNFYDFMVEIHDIGARGYPANYPDQEHKSYGFLPWHRAFLLELERAMQSVDPSVTLPYWPIFRSSSPSGSEVFQADFTGSNGISPDETFAVSEPTDFTPGNPLYGWYIASRGPLTRWTFDRANPDFNKPSDLIDVNHTLKQKGFFTFATNSIEDNPHNFGHGWSGVWMSNCRVSPSDPLFWPFHSYFDWLWAAWQQSYGRLGRDGADSRDFYPTDQFAAGSTVPIGHHLKDTMWPWNGDTTQGTDFNRRRPDSAPGGKFPQSGIAGVWPSQDSTPMVADLIDYAGYISPADDTNVGYDSIPWSPKQGLPPLPGGAQAAVAQVDDLLDAGKPLAARLDAAAHVDLAAATERSADIEKIAADAGNDARLRLAALKLLERIDTKAAVLAAIDMRKTARDPALKAEVKRALAMQMFAGVMALPATAAGPPPADRSKDYGNAQDGAVGNDPGEVQTLSGFLGQFLAAPDKPTGFPPQDIVSFIAATNVLLPGPHAAMPMGGMASGGFDPAPVRANLRALLALRTGTPVAAEADLWKAKGVAALALIGDPDAATPGLIRAVALDPSAPVKVRAMALLALSHFAAGVFVPAVRDVAYDTTLGSELRARAAATVGAYVSDNVGALSGHDLDALAALLAPLRKTADAKLALAAATSLRLVDIAKTATGGPQ